MAGKYEKTIDSDSAHERLERRAQAGAQAAAAAQKAPVADDSKVPGSSAPTSKTPARRGDTVVQAFAKSFARQLGGRTGQALIRGVLGGLFKGR